MGRQPPAYSRSSANVARASSLADVVKKLDKPRAALKAFRNALRINPHLEAVAEVVRTLEKTQGE